MFSDFQRAFKEPPFYESQIPEGILRAISEPLPKGFKYVNVEDGLCRIETEGEFNVGSGHIVLPKTAKTVFSEHIDMVKLWTYLYNSQQKAQLLPDKNGCYLINGEQIKAEDLIIAPFKENIVKESTKFYLSPPAFPGPVAIEIGSLENKRKIMIQRKPNNSISKMNFQSISNSALNINFTIDSETNEIAFSIGITEKNAVSIEDIVSSNEIYNAFVLGRGYVNGRNISVKENHMDTLIPKEVVDFWNNVLELERYLNITFILNEEITVDIVDTIAILYRCLIKKLPYKKFENFETVSGKGFNKKYKKYLIKNYELLDNEERMFYNCAGGMCYGYSIGFS